MNDVEQVIRRKIQRLRNKTKLNDKQYRGNEQDYTFHGGFNSGYFEGKLCAYEEIADELGIDIDS